MFGFLKLRKSMIQKLLLITDQGCCKPSIDQDMVGH